jgi:signal recognition particle subunit SRP54
MLDQLSERIQSALGGGGPLAGLMGGGKKLTDENMQDTLREIRRALLEADVSLKVIRKFLDRVEAEATGQQVLKSVNPSQQLIKIVNDALTELLGRENTPLKLESTVASQPPLVVLFGLQGSGKTTTAAKLAKHLASTQGKKPLLVAADVYRPAAIKQLQTLGQQIGVPVHTIDGSTNVQEIAQSGVARAVAEGLSPVIIDTAGRLQIDTQMMAELLILERSLQPQEKLLVIDSMTGQEAVNVAQTFDTQLGVTGLVLTKMDGDARGGAALSVVEVTGKPIKFIGVSEKMDGLEPFYPDRMAGRILGMGDVVSLVEKAQQSIDLKDAEKLEAKLRKQSFSLNDFMGMQKTLKMLGSLEGILNMLPIPGLTKDMKQMIGQGGEAQFKRFEAMYHSMTKAEREHPETIHPARQRRIAKGCGMADTEVAQFLKQFEQMRMMMGQMMKFKDGAMANQDDLGTAPTYDPTGGSGLTLPRRKKKPKAAGGFPDFGSGASLPPGFPGLPTGGMPGGFPGMGSGKKPKLPFPFG